MLGVRIGHVTGQKWPDSSAAAARKAVRDFEACEVLVSSEPYKPRSTQPQALEVIVGIMASGKLVHEEGAFEA